MNSQLKSAIWELFISSSSSQHCFHCSLRAAMHGKEAKTDFNILTNYILPSYPKFTFLKFPNIFQKHFKNVPKKVQLKVPIKYHKIYQKCKCEKNVKETLP